MSTRKRSAAPEDDDLADVPFIDDAERAESEWLLARENDPSAPAPSSKIESDYAEIEDLLATLPSGISDESWHDEVLRVVSSSALPSRPWWRSTTFRWAMGGAFVAAAAIAVWVVIPRPPAELEVATRQVSAARSDPEEVVVGDHLVVTARPRGAGDLRVYRSDGILVARCPHGPVCRTLPHGEYTIELTLDAPAQYQVILVVGMGDAALNGTMEAYLDAAHAANARIVRHPPINVH
jgi:hypothetical protein